MIRRVRARLLSRLRPLVVCIDPAGIVSAVIGDAGHYGYQDLASGQAVASVMEFVAGLPAGGRHDLPRLEAPNGRYVHAEVDLTAAPGLVILSDAGVEHRSTYHRGVEFALEESEERFRAMVDSAPVLIWMRGPDKASTYFNRVYLDFTGRRFEEQLGDGWARGVHSDDRDYCLETYDSAFDAKDSFELEYRLRHVAGEYRWVLDKGVPRYEADGRFAGYSGSCVDITVRRQIEESLRQQRREQQVIFDSVPALIWYKDRDNRVIRVNRQAADSLGKAVEEVEGRSFYDLYPEQAKRYHRDDLEVIESGRPKRNPLESLRTAAGGLRLMQIDRLPYRNERGEIAGVIVFAQDVTERIHAETELRRLSQELEQRVVERTAELQAVNAALAKSEERYALAASATEEGLWDWNLVTDTVYYSPRWKAVLGYEEGEISDSKDEWLSRIHPDEVAHVRSEMEAHLCGTRPVYSCEYRVRHRDGRYRWMYERGLALRDADGRAYRIAGSLTDISRRKAIEERLRHDALHDGLTGLPNRVLLVDRLERCIARRHRDPQQSYALLFMDLDRFKVVNDSLGHLTGDQLLVATARRLNDLLRGGDTLARLGGDEFAVLLEDISGPNHATHVAERMLRELGRAFELGGQEIHIGASIGIALSHSGYDLADDVIRDADTAMYRAKAQGASRYQVFDAAMHEGAMRRLRLENDLRLAIDRDQLRLHYQPVVDLDSGLIIGVEALARWRHQRYGIVPPSEFISLAEETGLIVPLGEWVIRTACAQAGRWRDAGRRPVYIAVNISGVQFRHGNLAQTIREALRDTGLAAARLALEVTESSLIPQLEVALSTMRELKELGLMLFMDDFGTGYSSLSYLKRFPVDTIKIDQSFVHDVACDANDAAIVTAINAMARSLRMDVIAEGVETEDQLRFLRGQGCRKAQGFLFSPPRTPEEVSALLVPPDRDPHAHRTADR
ncbi:MAG: sensor domain-containing protein [Gammaproteobacteria bacterium]